MKEIFENVEVEVLVFATPDVITSSTCPANTYSCEFELPIIPTKP